ncbi:hypothetical protein ENBRE01_2543 [Enteropsectra breve]|nr:hypothetical protein ENBRE01_2543 [Enteropsectra breve]
MKNEIIHGRHRCFQSIEDSLECFLEWESLIGEITYGKCGCEMKLKVYKENSNERLIYRCTFNSCRAIKSFFNTNLRFNDLLFLYYSLFYDLSYAQIQGFFQTSDATIAKARKELRRAYSKYISMDPIILGGIDVIVECDETVISRRRIIRSPTSTDDSIRDTVWILGIIDNTNEKNFYLTRVPNRTVETISCTLAGKINCLSMFYTDGYPSYPAVACNMGLRHSVVNHPEGFRSITGEHTNNIESFWSH